MLSTVCLFLCVVSVHSVYDVNVNVSLSSCLNIYDTAYDGAELYIYLSLTSASEYYVFMTRYYLQDSRYKFITSDNMFQQNGLLLGKPNLFSNISSLGDFDIVLSIVPILINTKSDDLKSAEKCPDDAVQSFTVSPRDLFQNNSTTKSFEIDPSGISCFKGDYCKTPNIKIGIEFDCHGPCSNLLVTTTTAPVTLSPTTTSTDDSATTTSAQNNATSDGTASSPATTRANGTAFTKSTVEPSELTTTTGSSPPGGNKSAGGMIAIGILAAIELLIILGMCLWFFKKYKPGLLKRSPRAVRDGTESDSVTYENPRNQSARTAPVNGTRSQLAAPSTDYADVDEAAEYTAIAKKAPAAPSSDYADVDETGEYTAIAKKAPAASSSDYADVDETGEYTAIVKPAPRKPKKEATDPKMGANDVVDKPQFANNEMYD